MFRGRWASWATAPILSFALIMALGSILETILLASSDGVPVTATNGRFLPLLHTGQRLHTIPYVWNTDTLAFEPEVKAAAGGGGGDASAANQATEIARLEAIRDRLPTALSGDRLKVELPAGGSGLTDTELRASALPVSATALPLPSGAATFAQQDLIIDGIDALLTELQAKLEPGDTVIADVSDDDTRVLGRVKVFDAVGNVITVAKDSTLTDGSQVANVSDRDVRLLGRVKLLDASGAVIDPALKSQLPAALVGGRLSVDASGVAVPITDNAGSLTIDAPVGTPAFVRISDGAAALIGQKAMAASLPVVLASDQSVLPVAGSLAADAAVAGNPVLNAGRTSDAVPTAMSADGDVVHFWLTRRGAQVVSMTRDQVRVNKSIRFTATNAAVADTILSCILNTDGVDAGAGATTFAVTGGKRFRFTHATLSLRTTTAANPWGLLSIRMNPAGAAVIGSPVVHWLAVGGTAAVAGNTASDILPFPDGWEISGAMQVALTFANNVNTNVTNIVLHGYEYTP